MAKVVVDVPNSLLERVRGAVDQDNYADAQEFIAVALENQIQLERTGSDTEEVMTLEQVMNADRALRIDGTPSLDSQRSVGCHDLETLGRKEYNIVSTVSAPAVDRLDEGPLWGQYNRIFPVKLVVRVLANELRNQAVRANSQVEDTDEEWVSLDRFSGKTAKIAREYGLNIQKNRQE